MNAPRPILLSTVLVAALLGSTSARAECPASAQQVAIEGDAVFASYEARDLEGVHLHASEVRRAMDCLQERLTPQQAASAHVAMALSSFLNRDFETTEAAFRAAFRADPNVALPSGVPEGHPLQQAFARASAAAAADAETEPMGADPAYELVVDGTTTADRPTGHPAVLQAVQGTASVHSTYLLPSSSLPDWANLVSGISRDGGLAPAATTASTTASTSSTVPEPARQHRDKDKGRDKAKKKGPSVGLLVASGGMALASAGLWTAAFMDGSDYIENKQDALDEQFESEDDLQNVQDDLDRQYVRVNSLGYAAQGTAALTGVLFAAAFVF